MSLQANFMSRLTLIGEQGQKPFMYEWCAGPAGIGLGRLAQFGGGTPEVREEIQAAVGDATAWTKFPGKPSVLWPMRPNRAASRGSKSR